MYNVYCIHTYIYIYAYIYIYIVYRPSRVRGPTGPDARTGGLLRVGFERGLVWCPMLSTRAFLWPTRACACIRVF